MADDLGDRAQTQAVAKRLGVGAQRPVTVDDHAGIALEEQAVGNAVVSLGRHHAVGVLEVVHEGQRTDHGLGVERRGDAVLSEDGAAEAAQERDQPEGLGLVEDEAELVVGHVGVRLRHGDQLVAVDRTLGNDVLVPVQHEVVAERRRSAPQGAVDSDGLEGVG